MNDQRLIASRELRAFYGRVLVVPSDVEEAETATGIIVPAQFAGSDKFKRGIVLNVATEPSGFGAENLAEGTVVYYLQGLRIHDVDVVNLSDVLAFEAP